ncbi:hypothetical protein [Endozoicomonas numazuensis]|uniref:Uncharacterized protein n=1 Tax=Endozoicomonas numazuensis TaxID=1137799 RepID=A0A081NIX1_9GAMM|nr:hypothetical protein [Endozoicomonas numazuensis]KEQ18394.1 hypothetical protein GZ78_12895 [Endozoicomonas numazuensis]
MSQWALSLNAFSFSASDSFQNSTLIHQWPNSVPNSSSSRSGSREPEGGSRPSALRWRSTFSPTQARKSLGLTGGDDEPPEEHFFSTEEEKRKYRAMKAEQERLKQELLFSLLGKSALKRLSLMISTESSADGMLSRLLVAFLLYAQTNDFDFSMDEYHVEQEADYIQAYLVTLGFVIHFSEPTASLDQTINDLVFEQYTHELVEFFSFQQLVNFLYILERASNSEIEAMAPRLIQGQQILTDELSESLLDALSMAGGSEQSQVSIQNGVSHFLSQLTAATQQQTDHLPEHLAAHLINVLPFDLWWYFARNLRQRLGPDQK